VNRTAVGIGLMLLATSATNVGAVLQKKAVDRLPAFDAAPAAQSLGAVVRSPLWLAGWAAGVLGIGLNMAALAFADFSVVQPLNGFGLVVLAVASRLLLGERPGTAGLAGIACVVGGVAAVGASLPPGREFDGTTELLACYLGPAAAAVLGAGLAAVAGLAWIARRRTEHAGVAWALAAAACSVLGLTFSKGVSGLVAAAGPAAALSFPPSYLLVLLLLTGSVAAMVLQQLSFQKGRSTVVTPVFAAASVVFPLIPGRIMFGEQPGAAPTLAVPLVVAGVVLLGTRAPSRAAPAATGT